VTLWTVDGVTFNGDPDADDSLWLIDDSAVTGWSSSAPPRPDRTARPNGSGAYRGPDYRDARIIVLPGTVSCRSFAARERAELTLSGLLSDPDTLYKLSRVGEIGTLYTYVEMDDEIQVTGDKTGLNLAFSMQLAAPDPRRFADGGDIGGAHSMSVQYPQDGGDGVRWNGTGSGIQWSGPDGTSGITMGLPATGGSITVTNQGNAPADVVLTIDGPAAIPEIVASTGQVIGYGDSIPEGAQLVIDTGSGSVTLDGANRRSLMTSAGWFSIPPRTSIQISFRSDEPSPDAVLTVQWVDTY
jgi:hypothetical protein